MAEKMQAYDTAPIAEMTGGIVLASYERDSGVADQSYQSEAQLEENMIRNLVAQGYERIYIHDGKQLYNNLRLQIQRLNGVAFSDGEWARFQKEYLNCSNDGMLEKTRKIQEDYIHDFKFDDGHIQNIKIIDKKNIHNNTLQVTNQVSQVGSHKNRYDVSILVNGLPLVHVELKRRGVGMQEAYDQICRYKRESFNTEDSLYKYVQIFVVSNGTHTRYFANTTTASKNNFKFTCEWADARNRRIHDLEDFTKTFFEKRVILEILTKYCVFDASDTLLIMRPYQIAATERILWKIKSSYENKKAGQVQAGGFIWHTTGSGKTLTSFKAARLATTLDFIDKVFFVVDRKDLDYQTMKEYQRFQKDSVNGSKDTKELQLSIEKEDSRIVVTTIQKLNEFVKKNPSHPIYNKHCVLIYDECHRSQFGDAQKKICKAFKNYYQFGFTGTPIFPENSINIKTTADVFGAQLHAYVITDAIRDEKVLKFKVDYNNVKARFREAEIIYDECGKSLPIKDSKLLLHPDRISAITEYILRVFDKKTRRNEYYDLKNRRINGFNAMFAVQSVDAAKKYYDEFARQQEDLPEDERLKVATIFSYAANEEQKVIGEIEEENFEPNALNSTAKQFLDKVIADYNKEFKTNFSSSGIDFQNYYKDLSLRVKNREVDIIIVVGMFLTGFDAPTLNTLFVDKNLRYHGLIQAYSRTNRILNKVKAVGNIVCFRDLEKATKDAIKLFGDENSVHIILERSYEDYLYGYKDEAGKYHRGFIEICNELKEKFSNPTEIVKEADKAEFIKLFGEYLRTENILKNFDAFDDFEPILSPRLVQDMKSVYVDLRNQKPVLYPPINPDPPNGDGGSLDGDELEFEIELIKSDDINLDYILALILEKAKEFGDKDKVKEEIGRVIRSSIGTRAKESLVMDFINTRDLNISNKTDEIIKDFYEYAKEKKNEKINALIEEENLKGNPQYFIEKSIRKGSIDDAGEDLDAILPPVSRRGGAREKKKQSVLEKIRQMVEVFVGI